MKSIIYIGMDVHKETIQVAVFRDQNRNVEFERQIKNDTTQIKKFFTKLKKQNAIWNVLFALLLLTLQAYVQHNQVLF